jgi:hypothetical protein
VAVAIHVHLDCSGQWCWWCWWQWSGHLCIVVVMAAAVAVSHACWYCGGAGAGGSGGRGHTCSIIDFVVVVVETGHTSVSSWWWWWRWWQQATCIGIDVIVMVAASHMLVSSWWLPKLQMISTILEILELANRGGEGREMCTGGGGSRPHMLRFTPTSPYPHASPSSFLFPTILTIRCPVIPSYLSRDCRVVDSRA